MHARQHEYKVHRDSEVGRIVREAAISEQPIHVDTGETTYRVVADAEPPAQPPVLTAEEVAASVAGIRKAAGTWKGLIDADAFKAYVRERRKTANRPSLKQ